MAHFDGAVDILSRKQKSNCTTDKFTRGAKSLPLTQTLLNCCHLSLSSQQSCYKRFTDTLSTTVPVLVSCLEIQKHTRIQKVPLFF